MPVLSAINLAFCREKRAPQLTPEPHAYQARMAKQTYCKMSAVHGDDG